MAGTEKPLREPGLIVYLSGLGTSAFVLWLVHYLNESQQFNIMGWYVNGILPAGAIIVGVISGLGYAVASRWLHAKLSRAFVVCMLATALVDYVAAQYLTYLNVLDQHHIQPEQCSFLDYTRVICEGMAFKDRANGKPGDPLGAWGYLFKLLEMSGYVAGAVMPSAVVFGMPYCKRCQKYLAVHRIRQIQSSNSWEDVKRLNKKVRGDALQETMKTLVARAMQIAAPLATASLSDTDAMISALDNSDRKDAAARVTFTLKKCPTCEAHVVEISLYSHSVNNQAVVQSLANFDKTEVDREAALPG